MTDIALTVVVLGAVLLAVAVDVAALVSWLRRRTASPLARAASVLGCAGRRAGVTE